MTQAAMKEQHVIRGTVGGFVGDAPGHANELRDELQSWLDNLPENLQSGDKAQALEEAISYLDEVADDEIEVPECLEDRPASFYWKAKKRESRSTRRDYIVAMLKAATEAAEEFIDEVEEPDDAGERAKVERQVEDATDFMTKVEDWINTLEGVEFPGMF